MFISVVGAGYVGLVTGALFASLGHYTTCIDIDRHKIKNLKRGKTPFYEPGLDEMIQKSFNNGKLQFTTDYETSIPKSQIIFICVGTPSRKNGSADTKFLFTAVKETARYLSENALVVIKSTTPVGIEDALRKIISRHTEVKFDISCCPEFLREGSAVADCQNPDRTVIGANSEETASLLLSLYEEVPGKKLVCDIKSAQMVKYASNAFLACKISFANAIAQICEQVGADVEAVLDGVGSDKRIGKNFLHPGVGYGGSCFPKDTSAFITIAKQHGYKFSLLEEVEKINSGQIDFFIQKIKNAIKPLSGKRLCVFGLAFKPDTDDVREAPSVKIIKKLSKLKAAIHAFDPAAIENAKRALKGYKVTYFRNPYEAAKGCDALIIVTEWEAVKNVDLEKIKKALKKPIIIDGRNIFDPNHIDKLGFIYKSIGRS